MCTEYVSIFIQPVAESSEALEAAEALLAFQAAMIHGGLDSRNQGASMDEGMSWDMRLLNLSSSLLGEVPAINLFAPNSN